MTGSPSYLSFAPALAGLAVLVIGWTFVWATRRSALKSAAAYAASEAAKSDAAQPDVTDLSAALAGLARAHADTGQRIAELAAAITTIDRAAPAGDQPTTVPDAIPTLRAPRP